MDPSVTSRTPRTVSAMVIAARAARALLLSLAASHTFATDRHPGSYMCAPNPAYPYTSYRVAPEFGSNGSPSTGRSGPGSR